MPRTLTAFSTLALAPALMLAATGTSSLAGPAPPPAHRRARPPRPASVSRSTRKRGIPTTSWSANRSGAHPSYLVREGGSCTTAVPVPARHALRSDSAPRSSAVGTVNCICYWHSRVIMTASPSRPRASRARCAARASRRGPSRSWWRARHGAPAPGARSRRLRRARCRSTPQCALHGKVSRRTGPVSVVPSQDGRTAAVVTTCASPWTPPARRTASGPGRPATPAPRAAYARSRQTGCKADTSPTIRAVRSNRAFPACNAALLALPGPCSTLGTASNPALHGRGGRSDDLAQPPGGDVEHEAADLVGVRDERAGLDPGDRLTDVGVEVGEGLRRPRPGLRPVSSWIDALNSSSVNVSIPQSVWWISTISFVPSSRWLIASERISSSVTTPPALRITCDSPSSSPRTA